MTDPVAVLTGDEELEVDDGDRAAPDAPAREPSQEEVPHDEGIEEQLAKKQGPWPSSNRTQIERDAMWRAAPGAEDPTRETEDVSPVPPEAMEDLAGTNPPSMAPDAPGKEKEPADPQGMIEGVEEMVDRVNQDLDVVRHLRDELDRVAAKARKIAGDDCLGSETLQERLRKSAEQTANPYEMQSDLRRDKELEGQKLLEKMRKGKRPPLTKAAKRVARILKKAGWPSDAPPKGIGLPSAVRPVNQAFIDDVNDMSKAAKDWTDQGWWYEKEFPLPAGKREPFKTALFLELAGTGERDHQFTTADTDSGVLVKVDRTERGLNPQFTKMANQVYANFDPAKLPIVQTVEQRKVAGAIKALIIRTVSVPREAHVCPHCEQEIGEKETYSPEEYREHPTELISQHRPCGGLFSQKRMSHQELMEKIPGLQPGEWHDHSKCDLNDGPRADIDWGEKLDALLARRGEDRDGNLTQLHREVDPGVKTAKITYPDAGEDAPKPVQKVVERVNEEGGDPDTPLLYQVLGEGTPDYKMSKEDADYRHQPVGDQKCGNCRFAYQKVVTGEYICSQVEGKIEPEHWCRLWEGRQQEKTAADKPFRRRVEVIITDGLNVWGEKKTPQKGGVWFPGGGVDSRDEKFADAAAREVIEESGFEVDEIYRLARIKPCECVWDDSVIDQASGKWEEKAKQYRGDRTHLYVATIKSQGAPTTREGDAMVGEWMKFSDAIRKLRNAIPHDNQGWKPLTRARLRAIEMLAPAGLRVPRRGEADEIYEEVEDG